ncbi:MAG: RsmE family RNA methyltransferase [Candidatus Firestonebacteria bacterium]
MNRFFVNPGEIKNNKITISGSDVGHIRNVLRLKTGDQVIVVDGTSTEYMVKLESVEKDKVVGKIVDKKKVLKEPFVSITLAQAVPKKDKMETIIRMTTELGVKEIIPMITERVIVREISPNKILRWEKIAEESAKQSGRTDIPLIKEEMEFKDILSNLKNWDLALIPWEVFKGERLSDVLKDKKAKKIIIFIGPEGGFSYNEINLAKEYGVIPVSLGNRILRVDTAGVVTVSLIMHEFNEI